MILLFKFLKLTGLNWVSLFGLFTLGSITIQEWEKYLGIICQLKKVWTTPIGSFFDNMPTVLKQVPIHTIRTNCRIRIHRNTNSLSSSILRTLVRWVFRPWLIILGMHFKLYSLIRFSSPLKKSLMCSQAAWAMFSLTCIQYPFSLKTLWINNFLLLPFITEWKYLELVSPSLNHWSWFFVSK